MTQGGGFALGAIFCCALWGISTPIVKMGYDHLDGSHIPSLLLWAGMLPVFLCLTLIYAASYTLWTILLKNNPASNVTIYSFTTPVFGVVFSALLLTEDSGVAAANVVTALVLVCLGILLWGYEKKGRK